jgi:hypothetical protein
LWSSILNYLQPEKDQYQDHLMRRFETRKQSHYEMSIGASQRKLLSGRRSIRFESRNHNNKYFSVSQMVAKEGETIVGINTELPPA